MGTSTTPPHIPLPYLKWRGFTIRIFLFTIIPVLVVILAIVFFSQYLHLREMRMMVGDRNLRSIRLAADNIAHQLQEKHDFLLLYEKSASITEQLVDFSAYFDRGIAVFDLSTNKILPLTTQFVFPQIDEAMIRTWESLPLLSSPSPVTTQDGDVFSTFIALRSDNDRMIIGVFDTQKFLKDTLNDLLASASVSIWVEDANQNVYFTGTTNPLHPDKPALNFTDMDSAHAMDGVRILPAGNGDQVISYAPIPGSEWMLIYQEIWGNVTTSLISTTFYAPFILIPLLVIAVIALWFGVRQIVIPLQKLQKQSLLLGQGDFDAIEDPVGGIEEIQQLQQQLVLVSHELQHVQSNLHQYIGSITAGVEKERHNLARELHDDTLQSLIALQMRVQITEMNQNLAYSANSPDLQALKDMLHKSIKNLRRLVRGLRPAILDDFGLFTAIKMLVEEMFSDQNLKIYIKVDGLEVRLPANVELALYRMIQEALSNAIRHSHASQALVRFIFSETHVEILIEDNGQGFTIPKQIDAFASSGHFGLLGMSERADLVGAKLEIHSSAEDGTKVKIFYRWNAQDSFLKK